MNTSSQPPRNPRRPAARARVRAWTRPLGLAAAWLLSACAVPPPPPGDAGRAPRAACESAGPGDIVTRPLQPLGAGAWWLSGAAGDSTAENRGAISNLLVIEDGERLWLVGSGPSAAQGRALVRRLACQLGRAPTDVISPWPRPELVLGQAGMPTARSWAHADVAEAMARRCAHCIERLALRLGTHAADLGAPPAIRLPDRLVHGDHGRLGPLAWWRLARGGDTPVTVWRHPASGVVTAHGLLWTDGAPDLRDTRLDAMQTATQHLATLAATSGSAWRWLPEQGPIAEADTPARHLRYWAALDAAVNRAQAAGRAETDPASDLDGVDPAVNRSPRHALNWQRAWRQAEDHGLAGQRGAFQRSLR